MIWRITRSRQLDEATFGLSHPDWLLNRKIHLQLMARLRNLWFIVYMVYSIIV